MKGLTGLLPILVSIPSMVCWVLIGLRQLADTGPDWAGMWIPGLSLVAFALCIALSFVFPNKREWRIAAAFNATPFLFVLLVAFLLPCC